MSKPLNWIPKKINLAINEILFIALSHFICKLTTFKKNNDQIDCDIWRISLGGFNIIVGAWNFFPANCWESCNCLFFLNWDLWKFGFCSRYWSDYYKKFEVAAHLLYNWVCSSVPGTVNTPDISEPHRESEERRNPMVDREESQMTM